MAKLLCWHCGNPLSGIHLPIKHFDRCPICREELHCCAMCRSYAPQLGGTKCRKDEADYVDNKRRANYCHYFQASHNAYKGAASGDANRAALDALFGGDDVPETDAASDKPAYVKESSEARQGLADLFGDKAAADDSRSVDEKSRQALDELFSKKNG